jgi:16S rRNA (cytidine1402-2'-O)-methyltransferase
MNIPVTLIAFEAAPRLSQSIADIHQIFGNRQLVVARELTKLFEECWRGTAEEILKRLAQEGPPKGEIVLVIEGAPTHRRGEDFDGLLMKALNYLSLKDASSLVSDLTQIPKKKIYDRALELKKEPEA